MSTSEANNYLGQQLDEYAEKHSPTMGRLLELTMMHITFIQLLRVQFNGRMDEDEFRLIRSHLTRSMEMTARIAGISDEDTDQVISKSLELVDSMSAIADPTRTNLH